MTANWRKTVAPALLARAGPRDGRAGAGIALFVDHPDKWTMASWASPAVLYALFQLYQCECDFLSTDKFG